MAARVIPIEIISDTICPWCFIGKRRLEIALRDFTQAHGNVSFNIKWKPFYLDPMAETEDKRGRYERKFGKERAAQMIPQMQRTAGEVGIKMEYGGKVGNTRNSHRLIGLAENDSNLQGKVVDALFHAYFEVNDDISSIDTLARIATDVKLFKSEADARAFLADETDANRIDMEVQNAYDIGVSGVPHFIIDNKYSVGGAQDAPVFKHIFDLILKKDVEGGGANGNIGDGPSC